MAIQYIGEIALEKLFHQPESQFGIARDGTVRATEVYACRTESLQKFAFQLYAAPHPTMAYLGIDDVDAQESEGGVSRIVVKYAGHPESGGAAGAGGVTETYAVRRAVSTEPIETNPLFKALSFQDSADVQRAFDQWKSGELPSPPAWWSFTDGVPGNAKSGLFWYKTRAVESYYEPKVEFVRTQVFNSRRNFARNLAVGKIGVLPSKFPKFPAPRNVLYKGADEETEGFATRITEVWELSGPDGWDKYLYGKSA